MSTHPFAELPIPTRPGKPRTAGRTMMVDLGVPPGVQRDLLAMVAEHVDLAKIAIGTSALIPAEILREKITAYADAGIDAFPGGMLLEHAYARGRVDAFATACREVGYELVEVSDNYLRFEPGGKRDLIRRLRDAGLRVVAEVGRKEETTDERALAADAAASLEAGAEAILVEAAELLGERRHDAVLEALAEVGHEHLLFELPGRWIPGTSVDVIVATIRALVDRLGPEVNIANVDPHDVILLENFRRRLATNLDLLE